jgi:hypothetical protein
MTIPVITIPTTLFATKSRRLIYGKKTLFKYHNFLLAALHGGFVPS